MINKISNVLRSIYISKKTMAPISFLSNTPIIWKGIFYDTLEYCQINFENNNVFVTGTIVGIAKGQPVNINYQIFMEENFEVKSVKVKAADERIFTTQVTRKNKKWFDGNGVYLKEFDNCQDIDISLTPFTNTIPIKRLHLNPDNLQILMFCILIRSKQTERLLIRNIPVWMLEDINTKILQEILPRNCL